jgi:hypothetical protein
MKLFTLSGTCGTRAHCETCRDPARAPWREELRKAWALPEDKTDFDCPHGKPWGWQPSPEDQERRARQANEQRARKAEDYLREIWRLIHTRIDPTQAFLDQVTLMLPCGECKAHWVAMIERTPPVFGAEWFAWTVDRHNEVNARLGKALVPLEEAAEIWGVSTPG